MKAVRIEARVISHATEDFDKVVSALAKTLGLKEDEIRKNMEVVKAEGHHGNPITLIRIELKGKKADKVVRSIFQRMEDIEWEILKRGLEDRSEGAKLFLRFDKQEAYMGNLRLNSGSDVVRILITFDKKVSGEELEKMREK